MKRLLAALLILCMGVCLIACESEVTDNESSIVVSDDVSDVSVAESEAESKDENTNLFKVKVVDADGNPVENVMLQVCKDSCVPAKTDAEGIASFNLEITDGYKLSVLSCPDGYYYDGESEIMLEGGITEYTLALSTGN
jgi:hypothetical protein